MFYSYFVFNLLPISKPKTKKILIFNELLYLLIPGAVESVAVPPMFYLYSEYPVKYNKNINKILKI